MIIHNGPLAAAPATRDSVFSLVASTWDDFFQFATQFVVYYKPAGEGDRQYEYIGVTKIGMKGLRGERASNYSSEMKGVRTPDVPREPFYELTEEFFSIGQNMDYYERLFSVARIDARPFLGAVRDLAVSPYRFPDLENEPCFTVSLMRFLDRGEVEVQYPALVESLSMGDADATKDKLYSLQYLADRGHTNSLEVSFSVNSEATLPTHVHAIIGRNGAGKSTLVRDIVLNELDAEVQYESCDLEPERGGKVWRRANGSRGSIRRVVYLSLGYFDRLVLHPEDVESVTQHNSGVDFHYIGLRRLENDPVLRYFEAEDYYDIQHGIKNWRPFTDLVRSPGYLYDRQIRVKLVQSMANAAIGANREYAVEALQSLGADPVFDSLGITDLVRKEELTLDEINSWFDRYFDRLSSGHKAILMSTIGLVEKVSEHTLVVMDEPEAHLHPPLLSAFIRVVSTLMKAKNGLAIIATHSPVVLQEVPRSCVTVIIASGSAWKIQHPENETFGESVGILTRRVFGLEVDRTGYSELLRQMFANKEFGESKTLVDYLEGDLGSEALMMARLLDRGGAAKS